MKQNRSTERSFMRHDTSTNMDKYKKDFDYLKINKDIKAVTISLYGNMSSEQISAVTGYIAKYFSLDTDLDFDIDIDPSAPKGTFNISWS